MSIILSMASIGIEQTDQPIDGYPCPYLHELPAMSYIHRERWFAAADNGRGVCPGINNNKAHVEKNILCTVHTYRFFNSFCGLRVTILYCCIRDNHYHKGITLFLHPDQKLQAAERSEGEGL